MSVEASATEAQRSFLSVSFGWVRFEITATRI